MAMKDDIFLSLILKNLRISQQRNFM